jgi:hypothetical protein
MRVDLSATVVDWSELGSTIAAAAVAGVGATVVFSLAVFGAARWIELRREGRDLLAMASATLTVGSLAGFVAAIIVGLVVMADK